jgi:hypothetical protein
MIIVFSFMFFEFAKFSSAGGGMSNKVLFVAKQENLAINNYISHNNLKIAFADDKPKLFLGVSDQNLDLLAAYKLNDNEMIIGSSEAAMMIKEKLITGVGSELKDFFGLTSVKIVGILKKTGTDLDNVHIFNQSTYEKLTSRAQIKTIAEDNGSLKLFYLVNNNAPVQFKDYLNNFQPIIVKGKKYQPLYVGSEEGKMMIGKKLITKEGDVLDGAFGQDFIVVKIFTPTNSVLDNLHYVDAQLEIK